MVHAKRGGRKEKLFFLGSLPIRCQRLLDYYPGGYKKGGSFFRPLAFFPFFGKRIYADFLFPFPPPQPPSDDCAAAAAFFAIEAAFFSPFFSPIHPHHGLPKGEKIPGKNQSDFFSFPPSVRAPLTPFLPSFYFPPPKPGEGFIYNTFPEQSSFFCTCL